MRQDGRKNNQLRQITIVKDFVKNADASVFYCQGDTKVICTATIEQSVPPFLEGTEKGWVTAEYSMLPRATLTRNSRDISKLKLSPRSTEIQRLIGRALRGAIDLNLLGERSIVIDCDVVNADGSTRCASITGGFIALKMAVDKLLKQKIITKNPIIKSVAAISVGIADGEPMLDLCYTEDSSADTDMNFVMTSNGGFIEIQGTAEGRELEKAQLDSMIELARSGCKLLFKEQERVLGEVK